MEEEKIKQKESVGEKKSVIDDGFWDERDTFNTAIRNLIKVSFLSEEQKKEFSEIFFGFITKVYELGSFPACRTYHEHFARMLPPIDSDASNEDLLDEISKLFLMTLVDFFYEIKRSGGIDPKKIFNFVDIIQREFYEKENIVLKLKDFSSHIEVFLYFSKKQTITEFPYFLRTLHGRILDMIFHMENFVDMEEYADSLLNLPESEILRLLNSFTEVAAGMMDYPEEAHLMEKFEKLIQFISLLGQNSSKKLVKLSAKLNIYNVVYMRSKLSYGEIDEPEFSIYQAHGDVMDLMAKDTLVLFDEFYPNKVFIGTGKECNEVGDEIEQNFIGEMRKILPDLKREEIDHQLVEKFEHAIEEGVFVGVYSAATMLNLEIVRDRKLAEKYYNLGFLIKNLDSLSERSEEFRYYEDLEKDRDLNPFYDGPDEEDFPMLLKTLHSGGIRQFLEAELDIELYELKLEEQIHLLRYLQYKSEEEFDEFKKLLDKNKDNRLQILKSYLACSYDLDAGKLIDTLFVLKEITKLDESVDRIFNEFSGVLDTSKKVSEEIFALYSAASLNPKITQDDIRRSLFENAFKLLHESVGLLISAIETKSNILDKEVFDKKLEQLLQKLVNTNENIRYSRDLVAALPREEVAVLDLESLSTVEIMGPFPISELKEKPEYSKYIPEILSSIEAQFPKGDRELFEKEYMNDPNAEIYLITCGGKLLVFFSSSEKAKGIKYIDWFIANPDSPVKGLGEAAITTFKKKFEKEDHYALAKPYVKSFPIAIERHDFVAFGVSDPEEAKHRYFRMRKMVDEENQKYEGKNLSKEQLAQIIAEKPKEIVVNGKKLKIFEVEFKNRNHNDDIEDLSEDERFLYEKMEEMADKGWIMSRFVPNKSKYICIFEEEHDDVKSQAAIGKLNSVVQNNFKLEKAA